METYGKGKEMEERDWEEEALLQEYEAEAEFIAGYVTGGGNPADAATAYHQHQAIVDREQAEQEFNKRIDEFADKAEKEWVKNQ